MNKTIHNVSTQGYIHKFPAVHMLENCTSSQPKISNYPQLQAFNEQFNWGNPIERTYSNAQPMRKYYYSSQNIPSCSHQEVISFPSTIYPTQWFGDHKADLGNDWQDDLTVDAKRALMADPNNPYPINEGLVMSGLQRWVDGEKLVNNCGSEPGVKCGAPKITGYSKVPGGLYSELVTPIQCKNKPSNLCYRQFVGHSGSYQAPKTPSLKVQQAKQAALEAIRAAVPKANMNCQGGNCAEISVQNGVDSVSTSINYELPLLILGNRTVTISASVEEDLERSYITR